MKTVFAFLITCILINPIMAGDAGNSNAGIVSLSGVVKDKTNDEPIIGATIFIKELKTGTVTDMNGKYSINLKPGTYTVVYSFMGYDKIEQKLELIR